MKRILLHVLIGDGTPLDKADAVISVGLDQLVGIDATLHQIGIIHQVEYCGHAGLPQLADVDFVLRVGAHKDIWNVRPLDEEFIQEVAISLVKAPIDNKALA